MDSFGRKDRNPMKAGKKAENHTDFRGN